MINYDAVNFIGDILQRINNAFQMLEDFPTNDETHWVRATKELEHLLHARIMNGISMPLHPHHAFRQFMEAFRIPAHIA